MNDRERPVESPLGGGSPKVAVIRFAYSTKHPEGYPFGRPCVTTSPGAIPSSHAERSWRFGATVLVEENVGRFFLRGTFKEGSRYGL